MITGQKTLRTQKKMHFNTATISFNDESENAYEHVEDLLNKITIAKSEAVKYVQGEYAPDPQMSMFEEPVTHVQIAAPEKKLWGSANPEAMERVAAMGTENEDEVLEKFAEKKPRRSKKVPQSATNPSGEAVE